MSETAGEYVTTKPEPVTLTTDMVRYMLALWAVPKGSGDYADYARAKGNILMVMDVEPASYGRACRVIAEWVGV
jgi:hypothetical protein